MTSIDRNGITIDSCPVFYKCAPREGMESKGEVHNLVLDRVTFEFGL
jgi:hypothetical protein